MAFWNKSDDKQSDVEKGAGVQAAAGLAGDEAGNGPSAFSQAGIEKKRVQMDPEAMEKLISLRSRIQESFGRTAMALMSVERYKHLSLGDLNDVILSPLLRDRVAMARAQKKDERDDDGALCGIAFWATVSEEVDAKIRAQISAQQFPIRLSSNEWNSGSINWLLDVIAPNKVLTTAVLTSFDNVVKGGEMNIHPIVKQLVDQDVLEKMK